MKKIYLLFLLGIFFISFVSSESGLFNVTDGGIYNLTSYDEGNDTFTFRISKSMLFFGINDTDYRNITFNVTNEVFTYTNISYWYSCDNRDNWNLFEDHEWKNTSVDSGYVTFRKNFTDDCSDVLISRIPQYGYNKMEDFMDSLSGDNVDVEDIGYSAEGRAIRLIKITNPLIDDSLKKNIFIISRQHVFEETGYGLENMTSYILNSDNNNILDDFVWYIVPTMNPDELYTGDYSYTEAENMNRKWNTSERLEVNAVKEYLDTLDKVDIFIDWHAMGDVQYSEFLGYNSTIGKLVTGHENYYQLQNIMESKLVKNSIFNKIYEQTDYPENRARNYVLINHKPLLSLTPEWGITNSSITFDMRKQMGTDIINSINELFNYERTLLQYKFNENSGTTAYDSSGNGNNGTISGATWTTDGVLNTLTAIVDYTIDTTTGLFTIVNSDYLYSWLSLTYTYSGYSTGPVNNLRGNFTQGIDNVSSKIPMLFSVLMIVVILGILGLFYVIYKKMSNVGGSI